MALCHHTPRSETSEGMLYTIHTANRRTMQEGRTGTKRFKAGVKMYNRTPDPSTFIFNLGIDNHRIYHGNTHYTCYTAQLSNHTNDKLRLSVSPLYCVTLSQKVTYSDVCGCATLRSRSLYQLRPVLLYCRIECFHERHRYDAMRDITTVH